MNQLTRQATVQLTEIPCDSCSGIFAITEDYRKARQKDGGSMYCPYCRRALCYEGGENARLKKEQRQQAKQIAHLESRNDYLQADRDHVAKQRDGFKGAFCKEQKRIKHGVCPCCKRTFRNLARHMDCKHPEFAEKGG